MNKFLYKFVNYTINYQRVSVTIAIIQRRKKNCFIQFHQKITFHYENNNYG